MDRNRGRSGSKWGRTSGWALGVLVLPLCHLAGCSDHSVARPTPWLEIESWRPSFEIVHLAEARERNRVSVRVEGGWKEVLKEGSPLLKFLILHGGRAVVVGEPRPGWSGWKVIREGRTRITELPAECDRNGTIAGHPARPSVLCAMTTRDDSGFVIVEFTEEGLLRRKLESTVSDPVFFAPHTVGVLADDTVVVTAVSGEAGHRECILFAIRDGAMAEVLARQKTERLTCHDEGTVERLGAGLRLRLTTRPVTY